ncbi:MAG: homocysteine S-methyltransferase family protein [Proteobacteria bacterium]|nr:homocysteine S-methyltransferase family protein [Pseudomonadota bacterium]
MTREEASLSEPRNRLPTLLDGATGTELERRGIRCDGPLWSAAALVEAPHVVQSVHESYAAAGCDVVTANTFRTHARSLAAGGAVGREAELTSVAVALARAAAGNACRVAGSAAPLEDCYRPDRVPPDAELEREHRAHAALLADAGVDLILVETMNCAREARAAALAAAETGLPVWVAFVCGPDARLLSGEPLATGLAAVADAAPEVLAVNCVPASHVEACLDVLARQPCRFGLSPNLGLPADTPGAYREALTPDAFAELLVHCRDRGAGVLGGCCGTRPEHLAALARRVRGSRAGGRSASQ